MRRAQLKALRYVSSLLLCFFWAACSSGPPSPDDDELLRASESATFSNVTRLGPHAFEAKLVRETMFDNQTTEEKVVVAWGDWDNFQLQRYRNERLRAENRVLRGQAYAKSGKGRFRAAKDAELYRIEMRHSASFWGRALEPFRGRVHAQREESANINGRPAHRYSISLTEAPNPARGHIPLALRGEMWLDESTAIRLSARLEGHYLKNGREDEEVLIALDLQRNKIGVVPVITRPDNVRRSRF